MLCQNHSNRFATEAIYQAAFDRMVGKQADRPACVSFRRWSADESHQGGLLRAVELRRVASVETRLLAKRVLQTLGEISTRHARNLPSVGAKRFRGCAQRHPAVEHQQHLHPAPNSRRPSSACVTPLSELAAVGSRQLQAFEPFRWLHPTL
jgi:hypothetical protein